MDKSTVFDYFSTAVAVADALGISPQAVAKWGEVVPRGSAYQLEVVTDGKLKVDRSVYDKHVAEVH